MESFTIGQPGTSAPQVQPSNSPLPTPGQNGGSSTIDNWIADAEKLMDNFLSGRQKLTELYGRIGKVLGLDTSSIPSPVAKRTRAPSDSMLSAKEHIASMLASAPQVGFSRGELATQLGIDTSVVGRALLQLADEKAAVMRGDRRTARWFPLGKYRG